MNSQDPQDEQKTAQEERSQIYRDFAVFYTVITDFFGPILICVGGTFFVYTRTQGAPEGVNLKDLPLGFLLGSLGLGVVIGTYQVIRRTKQRQAKSSHDNKSND